MDLIIGVDGGGSKTLALLANGEGRLLGRGQAGSSNYQAAGLKTAFAALTEAVQGAFESAQIEPQPLRAICLGMAGVDRPEDKETFTVWATRHTPGARSLVVNDAQLVLAAGTPEGWGLAVISGTGSIAYGCNRAGETARAGGWGHVLGDEGSGYAIGLAALRAVLRAFDGRGEPTALSAAVLDSWRLPTPPALIERIYRSSLPPSEIAGLATLVSAAAMQGDAVAAAILTEAGHALAETAAAVARDLGMVGSIPCAIAGGVLCKGQAVRAAFAASAREMGFDPAPLVPVLEPATGAVRLAQRLLTNDA